MLKTKTLFQTLELETGTWTIEIVHTEGTTQINVPRPSRVEAMVPDDPWALVPITHDADGTPLFAMTQKLFIR